MRKQRSHAPEKKRRNQRSERKAYDTIVRMLKKITPTDADALQLNASLHQLKDELIQLGDFLSSLLGLGIGSFVQLRIAREDDIAQNAGMGVIGVGLIAQASHGTHV